MERHEINVPLEYCVKDDIHFRVNSESATLIQCNSFKYDCSRKYFSLLSVYNKQPRNPYSKTLPLERCAMKECQLFTNYKSRN